MLEADSGVRVWTGEPVAAGTVGIDIRRESLLIIGLWDDADSSCGVAIDADR